MRMATMPEHWTSMIRSGIAYEPDYSDEAIQFIEKAGDDFENIDSIQLARTYANGRSFGITPVNQVAVIS